MTDQSHSSTDPLLLNPTTSTPTKQNTAETAERSAGSNGPIYQLSLEDGKVIRVVGTEVLLELMDNKKWVSERLGELSKEEEEVAATIPAALDNASDEAPVRVYRGEARGDLAPFFGPLRIETVSEGTSRLRLTLLTLS